MPAKTPKPEVKPRRSSGKPFKKGFDPRRNLKGAVPGVFALKQEILRDGRLYVDRLFRKAMEGDSNAIRYALDQAIGSPAVRVQVEEELREFLERLKKNLSPETYELVVAAGLADPP